MPLAEVARRVLTTYRRQHFRLGKQKRFADDFGDLKDKPILKGSRVFSEPQVFGKTNEDGRNY